MKIIFFTDFYHPLVNGVTAAVDLWANGLREKGHRVYIVAPASDEPVNDHVDVIRIPSVPSVWHKGLRDGIITPKYSRIIKNLKPDLYHFHTNGATGIAGMRLMFELKIPSVFSYHTDYEEYAKVYRGMWAGILTASLIGPAVINYPKAWPETLQGVRPKRSFSMWNTAMVQNLIRASVEYFDQVIVPSAKMERKLHDYGVTKPINILPTGLDLNDFPAKFSLPKDKNDKIITVLYVGRVAREKNIDVLLEGFSLARIKNNRLRLCIVGPGPYLHRLKTKVKDLHLTRHVIITGGLPREEALRRYAYADMFVFPSMTDTQALVLNEAAFMHVPIIYSDPEISDITVHNKTGILARPEPVHLAEAILELADNPTKRRALGKAGHTLAEKYSIDRQTNYLLRIYKKALRK